MLFAKFIRLATSDQQRADVARIQASFDAAPSGCIILAGDSHAAYTLRPMFPRPALNAGIAGSTAQSYARVLDRITVPLPASLSVLLIGTNDIRSGCPLSKSNVDRFAKSARHIIKRLQRCSMDVLISALPPTPPSRAVEREPLAVEVYSETLRELAESLGVAFFDPFHDYRGCRFGSSQERYFIDGTHLRGYDDLSSIMGSYIRKNFKLETFCDSMLPGFDEEYYKSWYPDTAAYPSGAARHYYDIGWLEGRDPCAHFSSDGYLLANPDILGESINPLVHFLDVGFVRGRAGWQKVHPEPTLYAELERSSLIIEAQKHLFERQLRRGR